MITTLFSTGSIVFIVRLSSIIPTAAIKAHKHAMATVFFMFFKYMALNFIITPKYVFMYKYEYNRAAIPFIY